MKRLIIILITLFAMQTIFAQTDVTTNDPSIYYSHQETYSQFQNNSNVIIRREPKGYYSVITTRTNTDNPKTEFIIRHDESTNNEHDNSSVTTYHFVLKPSIDEDDSARDYIVSDMEIWDNTCYFCGYITSSPIWIAPEPPNLDIAKSASTTEDPDVAEYGFIGKFDITQTSSSMPFKILPLYQTKRINNLACGHSTDNNGYINIMATGLTCNDKSCLIELHENTLNTINIFTSSREGEVFKDVVYTQDEFWNTRNGFGKFVSLSRYDRTIEVNSMAAFHMFSLRYGDPSNFLTTGNRTHFYDVAWVFDNYDVGAMFTNNHEPVFITATHNKNPRYRNEVVVSYLRSNPEYQSYKHLYMHKIPYEGIYDAIETYYIPDQGPAFDKILDVRTERVGDYSVTATLLKSTDTYRESTIHYTNWIIRGDDHNLLSSHEPYLLSLDISPSNNTDHPFEIPAAGYYHSTPLNIDGLDSPQDFEAIELDQLDSNRSLNYSVQREIDSRLFYNIDDETTCMNHETTPYRMEFGDLITYHDYRGIMFDDRWTLNFFYQSNENTYKSYYSALRRTRPESICTISEE